MRSTFVPLLHAYGSVTWANFLVAFRKLYFPPALCQVKTIELLNLKRESLSIDEYQQKFFELLPFSPHINDRSRPSILISFMALTRRFSIGLVFVMIRLLMRVW